MDRQIRIEMKKKAKHTLKKHYLFLVVICLLASYLGAEFAATSSRNGEDTEDTSQEGILDPAWSAANSMVGNNENIVTILNDLFNGDEKKSQEDSAAIKAEAEKKSEGVLGRSKGILAGVVNSIDSGSVIVTLYAGISSVVGSGNVALGCMIGGGIFLVFLFFFFVKNIFVVISRRIFLEARTYEKVPFSRVMFPIYVKKWFNIALTMFVLSIYQALWMFTIVGGIIKRFSYSQVAFIMAENPTLKPNQAITLSRKMMYGHKLELLWLDITFAGWMLLDVFSAGLLGIFFLNPYRISVYSEYYTRLRDLAKEENIQNSELLCDVYLFEKADKETVDAVYADVIADVTMEPVKPSTWKGIRGFLANAFGIVLLGSKEENEYENQVARKEAVKGYSHIVAGEQYPSRLFFIPEKEKRKSVQRATYLRHYSVFSLIMVFMTFSFIGWVYEVSIHLVRDGIFVNRGVLHGPWLPIYGTGGILIVTLLYRFRKNPVVQFITAVILCGIVEYTTSFYLEMTHGAKWWDYSGYYLNINGRVCAEGLLVFGLGGIAMVYAAVPLFDALFRKIPSKLLVVLSLVLLSIFITDSIYSGKHPNMGKGITDYSYSVPVEEIKYADKFNVEVNL